MKWPDVVLRDDMDLRIKEWELCGYTIERGAVPRSYIHNLCNVYITKFDGGTAQWSDLVSCYEPDDNGDYHRYHPR